MPDFRRDPENCERCRFKPEQELFTMNAAEGGKWVIDVEMANAIAHDGRKPELLPVTQKLIDHVFGHGLDKRHLAHVNPTEWAIAAELDWLSGQLEVHIIDGNHRLAVLLLLGQKELPKRKEVPLYFLTPKEVRRCVQPPPHHWPQPSSRGCGPGLPPPSRPQKRAALSPAPEPAQHQIKR
jgi:hypothetical protein